MADEVVKEVPVKVQAKDTPVKVSPVVEKPKRYVVDEHSVFEILGSTVTFRENQILTDPRIIQIAIDHNVPLRELAPIR